VEITMPDIRQIITAFGSKKPCVEIILDQAEHPRGSRVTGSVVLTGGVSPRQIRSVSADLSYRKSNKWELYTAEVFRQDSPFLLLPHSRHAYPLDFEIPPDALPAVEHPSTNRRLMESSLTAIASSAGWSLGWSARVSLNVTLHREVQAVMAGLVRLGFGEMEWRTHAADPPPDVVRVRYRPPDALRQVVEEVILLIQVEAGRTQGEFCTLQRGGGLRERVNTLAGVYADRYPLKFHNEDLIAEDGGPDAERALPRLREIKDLLMERAIALQSHLLRPAEAPEAKTLLRPAEGSDRTDTGSLLRPVEEKDGT
jgi:hypothetical protein